MPVKRILCIRFSSLGDLMLTLPVYPALRTAFSDADITLATKEQYAPFLKGRNAVDRVVVLPRTGGTSGLLRMAAQLRAQRFDLVVDLHANLRSRLLCLLVRGGDTVRYRPQRRERMMLVKHGAAGASAAMHAVQRYGTAFSGTGISLKGVQGDRLTITADERNRARTLAGEDDGRPVVGIFPGAQHGPKRYPAACILELCRQLARRCRVLVFNTDGTAANVRGIPGVTVVKGLQEPGVLLALIAGCTVMVATDSGPMHVAAAVGTPVIALFGPTHPALGFAPVGPDSTVLHSGRTCSPCSLHGSAPCRLGLETCMGEIAPETIITALEPYLGKETVNHG